ncbi:hypothetical protein, partial [Lysobacter xanthus]
MSPDPAPRPSPVAPAAGALRRFQAGGRLLRAPLAFAALVGMALAVALRLLPALAASGVAGLVAGAWLGLWIARPLAGRADLRGLLPAFGIAGGLAAVHVAPVHIGLATLAITAAVAAAKLATARLHATHEWDDPAASTAALAMLAGAVLFVALGARLSPTLWPTFDPLQAVALLLGALSGYASGLTLGAAEPEDPFAPQPHRAAPVVALVLVAGAALAAQRWPALMPVLAIALLVPAAGGRPRLVG